MPNSFQSYTKDNIRIGLSHMSDLDSEDDEDARPNLMYPPVCNLHVDLAG